MAIVISAINPAVLTLDSDTVTNADFNGSTPYVGDARYHQLATGIEATITAGQKLSGEGLVLQNIGSDGAVGLKNDGDMSASIHQWGAALINGAMSGGVSYSGSGSILGGAGLYARQESGDGDVKVTVTDDGSGTDRITTMAGEAIYASIGQFGTGKIVVDVSGGLNATSGNGILAVHEAPEAEHPADVIVSGSGWIRAADACGIDARINGGLNNGTVLIDRTGDIVAGTQGIFAYNHGGAIDISYTGNITAGQEAIFAYRGSDADGPMSVKVGPGVIATSGDLHSAIMVLQAAGAGGVSIDNAATIQHLGAIGGDGISAETGGPGGVAITHSGSVDGTYSNGLRAYSSGTEGGVRINSTGNVGAYGNEIDHYGIVASIDNGTNADAILVEAGGDVFAAHGIVAQHFGTGAVTIDLSGRILASMGAAVFARAEGGPTTIHLHEGASAETADNTAISIMGTGPATVTIEGHVAADTGGHAVFLDNLGGNLVEVGTTGVVKGLVTGMGADTFRLMGTGSASFDMAKVDGFALVEKTGSSTWTMTGSLAAGLIHLLGGTLVVGEQGAAGGADILFGAGAQTLRLSAAETADGTFDNLIRAFGDGDLVDVEAVAFSTAMAADFIAGQLGLDDGDQAVTLHFDGPETLMRLSSNSAGGTLVAATGIGTAGVDILLGTSGNDWLDGRGGGDVMRGGAGNDLYVVRDAADVVVEEAGGGNDQIAVNFSYALEAGLEIEKLTTFGSASTGNIDLTGNELAQTIVGSAGDNIIDGGGGGDRLYGYGGDDTYIVRHAGDRVFEAVGGGFDQVIATVSHKLVTGQEIEVLHTIDETATTPIELTGNEFAQTITGNAGNNRIDGGGGGDTLVGLGGNDLYLVRHAGDVVIEAAGGGTDQVATNVSWVMTAGQEIEKLTTFGSITTGNIDLTGNELGQTIVGNAGDNVINGKGGSNRLYGGAGSDTFVFDTARALGQYDFIADFTVGEDTIRLDHSVFGALAAGTLEAAAFHTGPTATDAGHRIIYNAATGALFYDADGAGGAAAVQFALLSKNLALSSADFHIV